MIRQIVSCLAIGMALAAVPSMASASGGGDEGCGSGCGGASSANMQVTAEVPCTCSITANPLNFGTYDPLGAHRVSPLNGTSTVVVTCSPGTNSDIGLDNGQYGGHAVGTSRAMKYGTSYLSYELFQNSGRTTVWTNSGAGRLNAGPAPSIAPRSFTVYGRIPAGQNVPPGSFVDTVVATVFF